jgi:hypothetical protein
MTTPAIETVTAAAVRFGDDLVLSVARPGRHHNIFWAMVSIAIDVRTKQSGAPGFLTSEGRFVDRYEGCRIARAANQILVKTGPEEQLFSEDVW